MSSYLYFIGFILLVSILTIESVCNIYTYDDGLGGDEHCCLARLHDKFCLAIPLTSSLVQANKQCQSLGANEDNKNYFNRIARRINIEKSKTIGDKILVELKTPIDKDILENDLVCLSSDNNNIDLEKCYVDLVVQEPKEHKQKSHHHCKSKKGAAVKNETVDEDDKTNPEEIKDDDADNKTNRLEITQPVQIRQGHGLVIRQFYQLNATDIAPKNRQCLSWYRTHTKELRQNPKKNKKLCIHINDKREKCLKKLLNKGEQTYSPFPITVGSKLYCEDGNNLNKLLGYHRRSEICFQKSNQILIEHKFTDFVSLADVNKNRDVLQFLATNTKLAEEFKSDCNDKTTLDEITKSLEKEAEAIKVDDDDKNDDKDDDDKDDDKDDDDDDKDEEDDDDKDDEEDDDDDDATKDEK